MSDSMRVRGFYQVLNDTWKDRGNIRRCFGDVEL